MFEAEITGGGRIRLFAHTLACACKLSETVFLEPTPDGLAIRGLSAGRSSHVLFRVPRAAWTRLVVSDLHDIAMQQRVLLGAAAAGSPPSAGGDDQRGKGEYPTFRLPAKALAASLLRNATMACQRIVLSAEVARAMALTVTVDFGRGVLKHYALGLEEGAPERAVVQDAAYAFDCAAEPRMWLGIVQSFPASAHQLLLHPGPSRLAIRAVDPKAGAAGANAALSTLLSVEPRHFGQYGFVVVRDEDQRRAPGGVPDVALAAMDAVGKIVEQKPLRVFALFADAMQCRLRLRTGRANQPVLLEALPPPGGAVGDPAVGFPLGTAELLLAAADSTDAVPVPAPPRPPRMVDPIASQSTVFPGGPSAPSLAQAPSVSQPLAQPSAIHATPAATPARPPHASLDSSEMGHAPSVGTVLAQPTPAPPSRRAVSRASVAPSQLSTGTVLAQPTAPVDKRPRDEYTPRSDLDSNSFASELIVSATPSSATATPGAGHTAGHGPALAAGPLAEQYRAVLGLGATDSDRPPARLDGTLPPETAAFAPGTRHSTHHSTHESRSPSHSARPENAVGSPGAQAPPRTLDFTAMMLAASSDDEDDAARAAAPFLQDPQNDDGLLAGPSFY